MGRAASSYIPTEKKKRAEWDVRGRKNKKLGAEEDVQRQGWRNGELKTVEREEKHADGREGKK